MPHFKPEEMGILYPNVSQSLHIGCNNYREFKDEEFIQVTESHNDVEKYRKFFKEELRYDEVKTLIDNNQADFR